MTHSLCSLLDPVINIAIKAGIKIIEIYATDFVVNQKADRSPVTEADFAAHHIIELGLKSLPLSLPVLSEESEAIPYQQRCAWDRYWLVDPLDGTREFVNRSDEFTVNIALIEENIAILGVVYVPASDVLYYACHQQGAFKKDPSKQSVAIHTKTWQKDCVVLAGSRMLTCEPLTTLRENIGQHELINVGSSLKSCLVAEGKADVYPRFGPTSEWDTAAAQCIVEEAGGGVTDTEMRTLRYNTKESLINPHFLAFGDRSVDWPSLLKGS